MIMANIVTSHWAQEERSQHTHRIIPAKSAPEILTEEFAIMICLPQCALKKELTALHVHMIQ